jgi:hypothetical protein
MKTRGIQNAINRLQGARKFGSATLLAQAEEEARHILVQARAWLARTPAPAPGEPDERYAPVAAAVCELAAVIEAGAAAPLAHS